MSIKREIERERSNMVLERGREGREGVLKKVEANKFDELICQEYRTALVCVEWSNGIFLL